MGVLISYLFGSGLSREEQLFQKSIGSEPIRVWVVGEARAGKGTLIERLSMPPLTHPSSRHILSFETCNVQLSARSHSPNEQPCVSSNVCSLYMPDAIVYLFQNERSLSSDPQVLKSLQDILVPHAASGIAADAYLGVPVLVLANHKTTWHRLARTRSGTKEQQEQKQEQQQKQEQKQQKQEQKQDQQQQEHGSVSVRSIVRSREYMCRTPSELIELLKQSPALMSHEYWFVQPVCCYTGEGVYQALEWLCQVMTLRRIALNKGD